LKKESLESGAFRAVICNHWAQGGVGATDLADAVIEACNQPSEFRYNIFQFLISEKGKYNETSTE
jgi:methylenetetrahydrofolate dehydrogenase (NADP+)/methenyltetrahydrofolate cyclohydrolase/formyltetrahydrofolate synthetase